jgi:hypothetical protein
MQDLIVSLNENELKISALKEGAFGSVVKEVSKNIVNDSRIVDQEQFATILHESITELFGKTKGKYRLNFVIEPEDTYLRFITVNKDGQDLDAKIISEIQTKLGETKLDDLYFSYIKIAPFVYQFVGVKKEHLEKYINISTLLQVELHSVLSWVLMLPKYVGSNESVIFICGVANKPTVVLSELGGVFFVGSYDSKEDQAKLNSLVQELSVYKRQKPIDKIYTFNYPQLKESEGFVVHNVAVPGSDTDEARGFESNLLVNYMLDLAPDAIGSQLNMLNLLPVPAVDKKQTALVKVGAPIAAFLIALTIFGGFMFFAKIKNLVNP